MSIEIDQNTIQIVTQYFFPGFCALMVFMYLAGKKAGKDIIFVLSFAIGYILNSLAGWLRALLRGTVLQKTFLSSLDRNAMNILTATLAGIIIAVILASMNNSEWFSKLMVRLFHKTPNEDIWFDVVNFKRGAFAKIYEQSGDGYSYIGGTIRHIEKEGNETWIALSGYWKQETGKTEKEIENHRGNHEDYYIQRISHIDHIEIFNSSHTPKDASPKKHFLHKIK